MIEVDIREHIKKIDEAVNSLKGADAFCSLMQAKSTALLALSLNGAKRIVEGNEYAPEDM
ncbi:hypothetical protein M3Y14_27975 [Bacillus thuringiensis]|uniref:hypothetical protein n=1 Tax=Bacillus thuringiensis TaxID=1428 RepID=UPI00222471F9|nr:hypothetical protein [Bacillus thuringiensis]UYX52271.1 hypothetical protein M3Y14_27975 [Bacillus thuringiensis]